MNLYDPDKVRFIKNVHLAQKKGDTLVGRQAALQQYREWLAAIANPLIRHLLKVQPFGSALLAALTFIMWMSLFSALAAVIVLIWGLVTWNVALLATAGILAVQWGVLSIIQSAINTELGARLQYVIDQVHDLEAFIQTEVHKLTA